MIITRQGDTLVAEVKFQIVRSRNNLKILMKFYLWLQIDIYQKL